MRIVIRNQQLMTVALEGQPALDLFAAIKTDLVQCKKSDTSTSDLVYKAKRDFVIETKRPNGSSDSFKHYFWKEYCTVGVTL